MQTDWLTKKQVAVALGISEKGVQRLGAKGTIQTKQHKRTQDGVVVALYHPKDVARLQKERHVEPSAFLMPAAASAVQDVQVEQITPAQQPPSPVQFMELMAAAIAQPRMTSPPLFLTLEQAAGYSGLGVGYLRKLIAGGKLEVLKGAGRRGAIVIKRIDLEHLASR